MIDRKRILAALALAAATLLPLSLHAADAKEGDPARNVKLTVRLGKLIDGKRSEVKSYDLVIVSGGAASRLLSGARVPLPTGGGGGDAPAFVYQNIGFTTEAFAWVLDGERIKIVGSIEDSRVVERGAGQLPTVETRQVSISAVLKPGIPMEVTRVDGIRDLAGFVEIEATIVP